MHKIISFRAALSAGALLLASTGLTLAADESGVNASAVDSGDGAQVAELAMAQTLFHYGMANDDALSILAAARITQSITPKDVEREVETTAIEGLEVTEEGEGTDAPADAEAMYAAALQLAAGDPALTGIIEDAQAEGARGRVGGPTRTLSRLRAGRRDHFTAGFHGGALAEIAILGDGDADLDLLVTDQNGNTICLDRSYSDQLYCSFTPAWTGNFHIYVDNVGRIRNSYYVLTN